VTAGPFATGDLVEYTGDRWTVDRYIPATPYKPARVLLGRSDTAPGGGARGTVTEADPNEVRLVTRAIERSIYPGDDWSWLVLGPDHLLKQAGYNPPAPEPGQAERSST
jgi:hypothetical protein